MIAGLDKLREIAHEWGVNLDIDGECGFGRPCVGMKSGMHYVDFSYLAWAFEEPEPKRTEMYALRDALLEKSPLSAYHKHDCLAVLGQDDESQRDLYVWVTDLYSKGFTVELTEERDLGPGTATISQLLTGRRAKIPTLVRK